MVRLAAELLLLLGLLLLTLHITVLRGSGAADRPDAAAGNASRTRLQVSAPPERGARGRGREGGGSPTSSLKPARRRRSFSARPAEEQLFGRQFCRGHTS